jgi:hypothetical protein
MRAVGREAGNTPQFAAPSQLQGGPASFGTDYISLCYSLHACEIGVKQWASVPVKERPTFLELPSDGVAAELIRTHDLSIYREYLEIPWEQRNWVNDGSKHFFVRLAGLLLHQKDGCIGEWQVEVSNHNTQPQHHTTISGGRLRQGTGLVHPDLQ